MKILAPVKSFLEAEKLINCGAHELYCGIHPRNWSSRHGDTSWLNRRNPEIGNLKSFEELKAVTGLAHEKGVRVFLTLNAPNFSVDHYDSLLDLVGQVAESNVDGVIISDPALIISVKKNYPLLKIHLSSVAAALNSGTVETFRRLGVSRIIFPRRIGIDNLKTIIKNSGSELEYEVFIFNDGCLADEGYCFTTHSIGTFCHLPWVYKVVKNGELQGVRGEGWKSYNDLKWRVENKSGCPRLAGEANCLCSLCKIGELKKAGVTALKILDRDAPLTIKTEKVLIVKAVLDAFERDLPFEEIMSFAQKLLKRPEVCRYC